MNSITDSGLLATRKRVFRRWIRIAGMCATLAACMNANAQEIQTFLRDVSQGTPQAQRRLGVEVNNQAFAREYVHRSLLLSGCKNYQQVYGQRLFDDFVDVVVGEFGSSDPNAVTMFTVISQMKNAVVQNRLSDDQVARIIQLRQSPHYPDFVEYLSFEGAAGTIATKSTDVVSGRKSPWVVLRALAFMQESPFYALLLAKSTKTEVSLLGRQRFDHTRPSEAMLKDQDFDALIWFVTEKFFDGRMRKWLPKELQALLDEYESLGISAMQKDAIPVLLEAPETLSKCSRRDTTHCVDSAWFASSRAVFDSIWPYKQTHSMLTGRFTDLCKR